MPLPPPILKSALLGTLRQPLDLEVLAGDSPGVDLPPEGQLLLMAARLTLREQAGYVPEHSHLPLLERPAPEPVQPCSEAAARYLRLILSGVHANALNEWIMEADLAHLRVRPELLPKLLLLGQRHAELRPFLLPLVGQCGLWLAREIHNQNWKWVFDTPAYSLDDLVALGRSGEIDLIQELLKDPPARLDLRNSAWMRHCFVWSNRLMQTFLDYWETIRVEAPRLSGRVTNIMIGHLTDAWIPFAYLFPLERREEVQARLAKAAFLRDGGSERFLESVQVIYDFRQGMVAAIKGIANDEV